MDMMRPMTVSVSKALPQPPVVTYSRNGGVVLTWTDGTPVSTDLDARWGSPANEVGYRIERAPVDAAGTVGAYARIGTALANATTFTDPDAVASTAYSYRVTAFNAAGDAVSTPVLAGPAGTATPTAPTALAATLTTGVRLVWRDNASTETGFVVERATGTGPFTPIATPTAQTTAGNVVYLDTAVQAATTYQYRVKAVNGGGSSTDGRAPKPHLLLPRPCHQRGRLLGLVQCGHRDDPVDTATAVAGPGTSGAQYSAPRPGAGLGYQAEGDCQDNGVTGSC
jgi:hypothetical protein